MSVSISLPISPPTPAQSHPPSRLLSTPRTSSAIAPDNAQSLAPPLALPRRSSAPTNSSNESSPVTDNTEVRSSSETTAATIFSMYGDDLAPPPPSAASPPAVDKDLPLVPPELIQTPATPVSSLDPAPTEQPPSIHLRTASEDTTNTSLSALNNVEHPDDALSVPSRIITVSSQSSPATPSRSSSHAYSVQAPDEDDDSYLVRSTYARLDHDGVPGDGFEEGKERTRTRIVSVYSVNGLLDTAASGLTPKEESVLKGLDRYGFFMSPDSHHDTRIALLPASPLKKDPSPLKHISHSHRPSPPELTTLPTLRSVSKDKESERIDKWDRMMTVSKRDGMNAAAWTFDAKKGRKLRSRLYKGIPDRWRGAAWWSVIEGAVHNTQLPPTRPKQKVLERRYRDLIDQPSTYDIQIDLDVPRTITGHVLFHTRYGLGQRSLFHVLHSFSLLCSDCGYVQGMGPIAATFLCYLEPEKAYSCLVRLHDDFSMHTIFQPGFPGLLEALYIQERLTERLLPEVYASFVKHSISSTSYATKWYITLFANSFPFQTQLRLWDAFLFEGRDFMIVVALAILWSLRDYLVSSEASFETILSLLSSYFVVEDEDMFMRWIRKTLDDKKLRADMDRWRHDWTRLVETGESTRALL